MKRKKKKYSQKRRQSHSIATALHLTSLVFLLLFASFYYPKPSSIKKEQYLESVKQHRKMLLEALDKYVRYQQYYREVFDRYTIDLDNLLLPDQLSIGTLKKVKEFYEIAVVEAGSKNLLLMARAQPGVAKELGIEKDYITIDQNHMVNSNFSLPPLRKQYLLKEADRILRLKTNGEKSIGGLAHSYWQLKKRPYGDYTKWHAVGLQKPVKGELRTVNGFEDEDSEDSIFSQVNQKLNNSNYIEEKSPSPQIVRKNLVLHESVFSMLTKARFAQHVFYKEKGYYTKKWEKFNIVTDFDFVQKVKSSTNIDLGDIEVTNNDYQISMKGIEGNLLGELFTVNKQGALKQIRYTDVIVQKLQKSTQAPQSSQESFEVIEIQGNPKVSRTPSAIEEPEHVP